ncbi:OadG family protein [Halomonas campisalis]|uniref:Probable oxaloacetate decarboxylase gamma chain n=1 Tax=Billgrantia campisalis TaxID=74661 RepID=A0ABS9P9G1_9GAMM|nr:OadG family protein [Halomonas campisalis]MCG6658398.1 OadG family protein [Halomonas campisalis]MDR5863069.1 OadG family protein [Halomonas campisalis]
MQDFQLLHDGLTLMGVGMGFVFVFLTVLVAGTTLMSLLVRRFSPAPAAASPAAGRSVEPARDDGGDAELMAVLSAAVHRYRRRHRR